MIYTRNYAQNRLNQIRSEFESLKRSGDTNEIRGLLSDVVDVSTSKIGNDPEVRKGVQDLTYDIDSYLSDMEQDYEDV